MNHMIATLFVLADGDIAGIFNSPYIIPIFGTVMVLGIVIANVWSGVRAREMRSQERLAAIAKGIPVPPSFEEQALEQVNVAAAGTSLERQRNASRRAGLVLVFTGLGLVAFFIVLELVLQVRPVLCGAAAGLIPAGIGLGFLVDAKARTADIEHKTAASGGAGTEVPRGSLSL